VVGASMPSVATRHQVSGFSNAEIWRASLLTGGLLVRVQPEEPIFSTTYRCERKLKI
jgi:hypothetical protein